MKKTTSLATLGLGLLLLAAEAAGAQYGSMYPVPEVQSNTAPAALTAPAAPALVLRGAACAVQRDPALADALLATVPRSADERSQALAFLRVARRCANLPAQVATSAATLRGAAAESLYEARFAVPPSPHTPALAAAPIARPAPSADPAIAALGPAFTLAECAAARAPELIRALLVAEPMTPPERDGFAVLQPVFTLCLPTGSQLQVDARGLRSLLAEALYRWSVVQRDGPGSAWAAR